MKLAYLITRLDSVGGAQVHIRDLATELHRRGHLIHVIGGGDGPYTESLEARGVTVHRLEHLGRAINPKADAAAFRELQHVLGRVRPQLLSTHSSKAGFLGRMLGKMLDIPTLFTAHGWAFTDGVAAKEATFYRWAEKIAAPLGDKIITVSEHDRQLGLQHRIASPQKIVTVHNGMPEIRQDHWAEPARKDKRMIMVARFQEQKDHETLFRALEPLRNDDWTLELIGDGPLEWKARKRVEQLGLSAKVHFLGARSDVAEHLARAQIFLLISHWEGFPRSILEAMRARLPVIASNVGGVKEAITEGKTGFLIPRQDANLLTARLVELLEQPELRENMGHTGREVFAANFTFDQMLSRTLAVYSEVISARGVKAWRKGSPTL